MSNYEYIERKIAHLKRLGLVGQKSTGLGFNGGAAPDWLVAEQRAKREGSASKRRMTVTQELFLRTYQEAQAAE